MASKRTLQAFQVGSSLKCCQPLTRCPQFTIQGNDKKIQIAIGVATLGLASVTASAFAAEASQGSLMFEAKVLEAQAKSSALAKVPNGVVKSSELEKEKGKLVWSIDVSQASAKGVTEIQVDAITSKIVSLKTETPAQ